MKIEAVNHIFSREFNEPTLKLPEPGSTIKKCVSELAALADMVPRFRFTDRIGDRVQVISPASDGRCRHRGPGNRALHSEARGHRPRFVSHRHLFRSRKKYRLLPGRDSLRRGVTVIGRGSSQDLRGQHPRNASSRTRPAGRDLPGSRKRVGREGAAFVSVRGAEALSCAGRALPQFPRTISSPLPHTLPRTFDHAENNDFPAVIGQRKARLLTPVGKKKLTSNFNVVVIFRLSGGSGELSGGPDGGGIYAFVWTREGLFQASKVRVGGMVSGRGGGGSGGSLLSSCSGADL